MREHPAICSLRFRGLLITAVTCLRYRGVLCLAAFVMVVLQPGFAAVNEAWVQRYSNVVSNANDSGLKVVSDAVGNVIVAGSTDTKMTGTDVFIIKYSGRDGSIIWQQRYNGPENSFDSVTALVLDRDDNVVLTGVSYNINSREDFFTVKYTAATGALLWQQRYNGPSNSYDFATAMTVDGDDNVVVTGYSANSLNHSEYDYYTAKYAGANGALLWEQRYNGPANKSDYPSTIAVDQSGNVVVSGTSAIEGTSLDFDYYTAKYAAENGALLWERRQEVGQNGADHGLRVAVDFNGDVVLTSERNHDIYTVKYAATDGALLWERRYSGAGNRADRPTAVSVDSKGDVIVTGISGPDYYTAKYAGTNGALLWEQWHNCGGPSFFLDAALALDDNGNVVVTGHCGPEYYPDYQTIKYAAVDGALVWQKRYNGPANRSDFAFAVATDRNGDVIVTGYSSNTENNIDCYTAKYAGFDGTLLWDQRYGGPANNRDEPTGAAVDVNGNVIVTGTSRNWLNSDYYTAKYAAASGALIWEKRYNGPGDNEDYPFAVAIDSAGNAFVTGCSEADYYTAKYAAVDGRLLWEKRYDGPINSVDQARALAVDRHGNVVVTGGSSGIGGDLDYYTAKYAAADGALLWEKRYNGPADRYDEALAVAIDISGDVIVTGTSVGNGTNGAYYTAKYAAIDGALLWEKRYNGRPYGENVARAVAVDQSGNVVVTGSSGNGPPQFDFDYYTAKYAAIDGALLWQRRYNGPGSSFDHGRAVAIDSSGNVVVTGGSHNTNQYSDYYTAKYAANDGALLWEKRYNGPTDRDDYAVALVLDGSGNTIVTGSSEDDYYTAKYTAADGTLVWEQRYRGPANGSDRPAGLAVDTNGSVVVAGSSDGDSWFDHIPDYATVFYREVLPAISIEFVPSGVHIRFAVEPNRTYRLQRAGTVTGSWSTLLELTAASRGIIEFTDASPPAGNAFYRTAAIP